MRAPTADESIAKAEWGWKIVDGKMKVFRLQRTEEPLEQIAPIRDSPLHRYTISRNNNRRRYEKLQK